MSDKEKDQKAKDESQEERVDKEKLKDLQNHFRNREDYNPDKKEEDNVDLDTGKKHTDDNEEKNNTKEMDNMTNQKAYMNTEDGQPKSPQSGGLNPAKFEEYGETVLSTIDLSYDEISKFLMDAVQELNPTKVEWIRYSHDKLTQSVKADNRAAIDTIVKITGANYRNGKLVNGFEAIPILVFDQRDVLKSVDYNDNLGAISRDMYELDFDKIKKRNKKFFPRYGMVTSYDQANNLVRVHVNIINVIISALGYEPGDFGSPKEMDKLYLFPKQDPKNETFKVSVINNKYLNDRILNAVKNM